MKWDDEQIKGHIKAAKKLIKIKDSVFSYLKENVTEYETQKFIIKEFKRNNLITDKYPPIVAFNEHTSIPEFYPSKKSKKLEFNSLVMIDIWAKLEAKNSPFADITWMAFYGNKIPKEILKTFYIVVKARNSGVNFIKSKLKSNTIPTGRGIEENVKNVIIEAGYKKNVLHETGHSLGTVSDHGPKPNWIYHKNCSKLNKNLGYTIEPGIYIKNKFGIRSEIDFFIDKNMKLILTTDLQKNIIKIINGVLG